MTRKRVSEEVNQPGTGEVACYHCGGPNPKPDEGQMCPTCWERVSAPQRDLTRRLQELDQEWGTLPLERKQPYLEEAARRISRYRGEWPDKIWDSTLAVGARELWERERIRKTMAVADAAFPLADTNEL